MTEQDVLNQPLTDAPASESRKPMRYDPAQWAKFAQAYRVHLTYAMGAHPEEYMLLDPQIVSTRMLAAADTKGIGGINIDSRAFRACAKEFGIKNTYKAWKEYLGGAA